VSNPFKNNTKLASLDHCKHFPVVGPVKTS